MKLNEVRMPWARSENRYALTDCRIGKVPSGSRVTLGEIATVVDGQKAVGRHSVVWSASVPSGIYFYRLQAGDYLETKKMILLK